MAEAPGVGFDLVVATVDRTQDLAALLESLESQTHSDDRVERLLGAHPSLRTVHLLSDRGLSRARNRALSSLAGDVIGFPDDDCRYPPDLLERVARRFAEDAELGGLSGRPVAADGSTVGHFGQRVAQGELAHDLPPS